MKLNKDALADGLSRELLAIRWHSEALHQKERELKAAMVTEDGKQKALTGSLLEKSVWRIVTE